ERAQGELEDALGHTDVRAGEAAAGGRDEPALLAQVDRELADAEQLRDPLDGGLQRVRERELGGGLTDDGEQGARPLELARELLAVRAGAQRVRGADAERAERGQLRLAGRRPG